MAKTTGIRHQLLIEFGRQLLVSVGIFTALFLVLFWVEWIFPMLRGTLLQWSDPAFVVGIPASVIGTAYVLTIRNPKNYIGFYGDIVMAILLAIQFHLQGDSLDLFILYLGVFVPFGIYSLIVWRTHTMQPELVEESLVPRWLPRASQCLMVVVALIIIVVDYVAATQFFQNNGWWDNVALKLVSGLLIASAVLANGLLVGQRIDAWIWWVVYSLSGMAIAVMIGNIFSLVLFTVFLFVNGSTGIAWIRRFGKNNG